MDEIEIHAHGLLLRPWQAGDADGVYQACQDPEIHRWTGVSNPYLREHAQNFVTSFTRQAWSTGTAAPFGVFEPGTGELLGSNGLISVRGGIGEIGYWVAPWARGRGIATRSTHAVATWALQTLRLNRVAWRAELGNVGSRLIAERLGFRQEGIQRNAASRSNRPAADCWSASLVPGQLRRLDAPLDPVVRGRVVAFGSPQPTLTGTTASGTPITLRPPDEGDIADIVAACTDPESVRWTSIPVPYQDSDARFFVSDHARGQWLGGAGAVFAVVGPDGRFAGSIELRLNTDISDTGEVGFLAAPWARGQGYTTAALGALCRWAFPTLGLYRIEWRAYVGNDASRRVAEKAGFTFEGTARARCVQRGEYRDAWTAARLTSDGS